MAMYVLAIALMMNVECIKNIDSYIEQQEYVGVSITNYPYISVFDEERVWRLSRSF